jgi:endonuclease/exonuclease/phosphatase family metal-dependent hydrolase
MSRCIDIRVRTAALAIAAGYLFLAPATGAAQTTVLIDNPTGQVDDARIQGGSFARTVFHKERLATKNHPSSKSYDRRTMLKFDTHNTVPRGAKVQSATLTLTVSKASAGTRTLGLYRLSRTFDERYANWYTRKRGFRWMSSGGDLAEKWAQASVGSTVKAKITFDITDLVQNVVNGKYDDARYTRLGLVDLGKASDYSYREFYNSEYSDPSVRPVLKVVYGATTPTPKPTPKPTPTQPKPTPAPDPEPENNTPDAPSTGGSTLKVLHWNIHRAWGTDGRYNLDRIATWIAKINPNIVSLNEVERFSSYANEDQAKNLQAKLRSKTGTNWYVYYRTGNGASTGHGNAILSRFPIVSTSYCQLSDRRTLANAAIMVNGRLVNFYATHLDSTDGNGRYRIAEVRKALPCLSNDAEQRIIAGDFNARDYTTEIALMRGAGYYDGWAEAASDGTAVDYPGNTAFGATRSRRIDYVWFSKNAKHLVLKSARMIDTRDARGKMPSDHKPMLVTFSVK